MLIGPNQSITSQSSLSRTSADWANLWVPRPAGAIGKLVEESGERGWILSSAKRASRVDFALHKGNLFILYSSARPGAQIKLLPGSFEANLASEQVKQKFN